MALNDQTGGHRLGRYRGNTGHAQGSL